MRMVAAVSPGSPPSLPAQLPPAPPKRSNRGVVLGCAIAAGVGLVLITIVAVVAAIAVPAFSAVARQAKVKSSRTLAQQVIVGALGYQAEYSRWPADPGSDGALVRTTGALVAVLTGTDSQANPRAVSFMGAFRPASSASAGLAPDGSLVDAWGEPFYLAFDVDGDGSVPNPDPASPLTSLGHPIIVFSAGPDKDPTTWADNVDSWSNHGHR